MNTQSDNPNSDKKSIPTNASLAKAIADYRKARDNQIAEAKYGGGAVRMNLATDHATAAAAVLTDWPNGPTNFDEAMAVLGFVHEELEAEGPSALTTLAGLASRYFANFIANESLVARFSGAGEPSELGHLFDVVSSMDNDLARIAAFVRMMAGTSHLMSDERDADAVDRMAETAEGFVEGLRAMRTELVEGLHKYRFPAANFGEVHHD